MTREINGRIVMRVSDDGTRCAAECPHVIKQGATSIHDAPDGADYDDEQWFCMADGGRDMEPAYTGPGKETFIGWLRLPACIAAEQAAASVPSREGAKHVEALTTLAANAEKNLAYIRATFPGGDPRDMDWYAREVAALVWAHKAAQAAAQEKL